MYNANKDANFDFDFEDWYPPPVPRYDPDKQCLVCGEKWTITTFNKKVWYDCLKCNKTKEDILNGKY
jgi:hypothetical protein